MAAMRLTALVASVSAVLLGCGGAVASPPDPERASTAASTSTIPRAAAQPAAPRPWGPAFSHVCAGNDSPVLVSPDGKSVAFCSARYDAEAGRYLDESAWGTHALLADGRVL